MGIDKILVELGGRVGRTTSGYNTRGYNILGYFNWGIDELSAEYPG